MPSQKAKFLHSSSPFTLRKVKLGVAFLGDRVLYPVPTANLPTVGSRLASFKRVDNLVPLRHKVVIIATLGMAPVVIFRRIVQ